MRRAVAASDALDEIEPARLGDGLGLGAHPAHDLFRIGQKGENRGGWGCDLGFASDDERLVHGRTLAERRSSSFKDNP
jgi:hypothetical protein